MSKPYMRWFWGDWFANTKDLTHHEKGVYTDLIGHYWERGSLPDDDHRLAQIVGLSLTKFRKIRSVLVQFFEPGWKHKKIEKELSRYRERSMKTREAALQMHLQKQVRSHMQMQMHSHANARVRLQDQVDLSLPSFSENEPREDTLTNGGDMPRDSSGNEITDDMRRASQRALMARDSKQEVAGKKASPAEALRQAAERAAKLTKDQITPELKAVLRAQQRHGAPPPQHELAPSAELKALIAAQLKRERGKP
jgi:uncharacterized protein YdaU (DUF1376 family)